MNKKHILAIMLIIFGCTNDLLASSLVDSWDCGKVANTVSCKFYEDGTFVISGSGKMNDYNVVDNGENVNWHDRYTTDAPWSDKAIVKVVVEDGVTSIANHAFTGNDTLTSVEGMKDVKTIGNRAFFDNRSLEKIDMPSATNIGYETFYYASNLTQVELPKVTYIGADAFMVSGLESIYLPSVKTLTERALRGISNLTSIDIPNVEYIGNRALQSRNLTYVGLPESGSIVFGEDVFLTDSILADCVVDRSACGVCEDYIKRGWGCVVDCGNEMLGKEGKCIDVSLGCGVNYQQIGNLCLRKRYTMPEADVATSNDNENMIEWIFE